ncbi:MAG: hypothetical protein IKO62_04775 [Bacteroidales bacterium]|nr:hypothetical protein [Paludibacteraceae bacterium]MBR4535954.1 hypothetical protein [Bacteroidales bacterium]
MKKWSWILIAVMAVVTSMAVAVASLEGSHRRSLARQVKEQSVVIDSLLKRDQPLFDVDLYVTDKSRNTIYGRYNRGTINMPQERRYILQVDSVNVMTLKKH